MEFKYSVTKSGVRRVRTPEGSRFFNLPIGSPITAEAISAAKRKHGEEATAGMLSEGKPTVVGGRTASSFERLRGRGDFSPEAIARARANYADMAERRRARRNPGRRQFTYVENDAPRQMGNPTKEAFERMKNRAPFSTTQLERARANYKALEQRRKRNRKNPPAPGD